MKRLIAVIALATGLAAAADRQSLSVLAQSPPTPPTPTFKAEVEYIEVDAVITDAKGRFVRDLRREDFEIREDGRPQEIASFSLVDVPIQRPEATLPDGVVVEPDIRSSERPFTGRMYVLILDSLHTSALRSQLVRTVARRFIDQYFHANDLMAIVHTDGRVTAAQDFTGSPRLLKAAVDAFMGQKLESATLARNNEFFRSGTGNGPITDPFEMERGFNARSTLRSLGQVADWLAGVRGRRKTILFISEGIDYDITDVFNNRSASSIMDETRDAVGSATRANVSIYAIDPRTLTGIGDDTIEVGSFADQHASLGRTNDDGTVQTSPGINSRGLDNERRLAQDSLRTLAEETTGFAAVGMIDLPTAFERIVGDSSAYYAMAYYPRPARRDGKFHRIEVRTTRRDLTVRARRGYVAPRGNRPANRTTSTGGASPEVLEALNSPIPSTGIAMRLFAAPFKGTAPNASVVLGIELRGRDLAFDQGQRVELSYVAVDGAGKNHAANTDSFTLTLPADMRKRVEENGLRILRRFDLPPGRYQIRVATRHSATGALGGLTYDLDVPDYAKAPFAMSGLLLSSTAGTSTMTARPDPELQKVMPTPPVSLRSFPQSDELLVFGEVYDNAPSTPHTVDLITTVKSSDGVVRFEHSDQRSSSELQGSRGGFGHTVRIPMSKLDPGRYVLTLEARSRLGQTATRQVPFEVVR